MKSHDSTVGPARAEWAPPAQSAPSVREARHGCERDNLRSGPVAGPAEGSMDAGPTDAGLMDAGLMGWMAAPDQSEAGSEAWRQLADEGERFAQEVNRPASPPPDTALDVAADLVADWVASGQAAELAPGVEGGVTLEFSVDSQSLGALVGRLSMESGSADVELCAHRPSTAAMLRARQSQLQQLVRRESGGDVELRIL